ncbi:hypothetical protein Tco_1476950 [Tanacetum coccineum]
MLERLAGNEYYCFLDGFSGYFQIPIDPKDQEKTTFTCPYGTFAYRLRTHAFLAYAMHPARVESRDNLPIELQHRAYWALKHVNFNLKTTGDYRKLQLNELNELRDQAYENSLIYKERTKKLHDSKIKNRIFNVGDQVLLFNSRLKIFSGKLKTRWSGPFTITKVFPYGTAKLSHSDGSNFKVNHRLKHYFGRGHTNYGCPGSLDFPKETNEFRDRVFTIGIKACALRNFDLEVMEFENTQNNALAKLPMLKLGEYERWEIRLNNILDPGLCSKEVQRMGIHGQEVLLLCTPNEQSTYFRPDVDAQINKVKKSAGASNDDKNLAFVTTLGASSTNNINIVNPEVSTATTKIAPMALSDSKVNNDKYCSKTYLKNYEALKKQYDDLLVKLSDTGFKATTYKRGLSTLEDQIVKYREHEVRFFEEIALLKRSVGSKEYQMGLLRAELEKITDKSKKGFSYNAVPLPHPLILNRPTTLDLSYSGLEEFKEPEVNEYGPRDSSLKPTTGCDKESDKSKENTDDSLEQHQMTNTQTSSFESPLKVDKDWKEKFFYPANHVESVNKIEKPVRKNNDAPIIEEWGMKLRLLL